MGLFKRISDIVSANLGEMAEQFEDPERMLKQAIQEMEQSIREATQETARALATEKKLARELANNEADVAQWQSRAEQAVDSGDDDLARKALSRRQEHVKLALAISDQLKAASDSSQTLRHQLDGMKAKLSEAKRNLATLSARQKAANVRKKIYSKADDADLTLEKSAFDKFDRLREKVEQAEAEAEALADLQGIDSSSWQAHSTSHSDPAIDDELASLKRQRQKDE